MAGKGNHGGRLFLKFLISFVLVAIIPFLVIEYLYLTGIRSLNQPVLSESRHLVTNLATMALRQKVSDVASELEIYFQSHNAKEEVRFKNNAFLQSLAVQPVGSIGFTEVHTSDGIPLFIRKKTVATPGNGHIQGRSQEYWKIFREGSLRPSGGFYSLKKTNGRTVRMYMFSAPVKGTNLVVSATTSMGRIEGPLEKIGATTRAREKVIFLYLITIAAGFLIYLIFISHLFARRITRPILYLAYVADCIGLGDLDVKIALKTRDETMILIEAMDRMQKSLKSAIGHLRSKEGRMT